MLKSFQSLSNQLNQVLMWLEERMRLNNLIIMIENVLEHMVRIPWFNYSMLRILNQRIEFLIVRFNCGIHNCSDCTTIKDEKKFSKWCRNSLSIHTGFMLVFDLINIDLIFKKFRLSSGEQRCDGTNSVLVEMFWGNLW